MATRETRAERGRKRGRTIVSRLVGELVVARHEAGLSQRSVASLAGMSQTELSRIEHLDAIDRLSVVDVAALAAVVGRELGANLYPAGEPIRDAGHQALIRRFRSVLSEAWRVAAEVPLPTLGDRRSWDLLLRITGQLVGIEAETRVRDIQAFVRRVRERELEGGTDTIVIVLAESAHNRRVLPQLLAALGPRYSTSARVLLKALREGKPLAGSGVVLI
jgi:transcriptional regulator with XRE-family HTH domain